MLYNTCESSKSGDSAANDYVIIVQKTPRCEGRGVCVLNKPMSTQLIIQHRSDSHEHQNIFMTASDTTRDSFQKQPFLIYFIAERLDNTVLTGLRLKVSCLLFLFHFFGCPR